MAEVERRPTSGRFARALPKEWAACDDGACNNPKPVEGKENTIQCAQTDSCKHVGCGCNMFSYPTKGPDHEKAPFTWVGGTGAEIKKQPDTGYACMCVKKA